MVFDSESRLVDLLILQIAQELRPHNIRALNMSSAPSILTNSLRFEEVNGYAPGITATALFTGANSATMKDDGKTLQEVCLKQIHYTGFLIKPQFLQRLSLPPDTPIGKPEYIASLVSYLSKPESVFITGKS